MSLSNEMELSSSFQLRLVIANLHRGNYVQSCIDNAGLINKARGFMDLPVGWCHGCEVPPSHQTVAYACQWIKYIRELQLEVDVFPGDNNSIVISSIRGDLSVDFEVQEKSILNFSMEKGIGFEYYTIASAEYPPISYISNLLRKLSSG